MNILLTTRNFDQASKIIGNEDFCFITKKQTINCHKFTAAFLSKQIAQILLSDPTANSFQLHIPDQLFINEQNQTQCEQQMANFLTQLIQGETIEITSDDFEKSNQQLTILENNGKYTNTKILSLLLLAENLENDELRQHLYSQFVWKTESKGENQQTNIKDEIKLKLNQIHHFKSILNIFKQYKSQIQFDEDFTSYLKQFSNKDYDKFIKEIASHFYEIDEEVLISLESNMLNDILTSSELKIRSEDSLLQLLMRRQKHFSSSFERQDDETFYELVRYEFVTKDLIENFVNELQIDEINSTLWSMLKKRLILAVNPQSINERVIESSKVTTIPYSGNNPFDGIFKFLTKTTNGNIIDNGTIEVKNPKLCCGTVNTLFDYDNQGCWTHIEKDNSGKSWIQFDFKTKKIQINSYMIKSRHGNGGRSYLKSWRIQTSEDENYWSLIDERKNVNTLKGKNNSDVFNISMTKPFRFIKLISDENWNSSSDYSFSIANIEFFGKLVE